MTLRNTGCRAYVDDARAPLPLNALGLPLDFIDREAPAVVDAPTPSAEAPPFAPRLPPRVIVPPRRRYLPVGAKFAIALVAASAWLALSVWLARFWLRDPAVRA